MTQPPKYDPEERTAHFAEQVIGLVRSLKLDSINKRIIEQLVGSSGSIGANYYEATEGESKKDFTHKIGISRKEAKETGHWLRLLANRTQSGLTKYAFCGKRLMNLF